MCPGGFGGKGWPRGSHSSQPYIVRLVQMSVLIRTDRSESKKTFKYESHSPPSTESNMWHCCRVIAVEGMWHGDCQAEVCTFKEPICPADMGGEAGVHPGQGTQWITGPTYRGHVYTTADILPLYLFCEMSPHDLRFTKYVHLVVKTKSTWQAMFWR